MTECEKEFYRGFAIAIGSLARDHDQPTMAADIMRCNGVSLQDLKNANVESFDLAAIAQSDYSRATYVIPAAGATVNISCCVPPTFTTDIAVNTALAAVNLAGNSYTLTYDSLPNKGKWSVYCKEI